METAAWGAAGPKAMRRMALPSSVFASWGGLVPACLSALQSGESRVEPIARCGCQRYPVSISHIKCLRNLEEWRCPSASMTPAEQALEWCRKLPERCPKLHDRPLFIVRPKYAREHLAESAAVAQCLRLLQEFISCLKRPVNGRDDLSKLQ